MGIQFLCTICCEEYNSTDDICSTSCGHAFHHHCLQSWLQRSNTCPECRETYIKTHRVYLKSRDTPEKNPCQLQVSQDIHLEQQRQLEQIVMGASVIQQKLDESVRGALAQQAKYDELLKKMNVLMRQNDNLREQNKKITARLEEKTKEVSNLRNKKHIADNKNVVCLQKKVEQLELEKQELRYANNALNIKLQESVDHTVVREQAVGYLCQLCDELNVNLLTLQLRRILLGR